MWVAAAIVGGAIIGGVATSMAANAQGEAAESAAATSAAASKYAEDVQYQIFKEQQEAQKPWQEVGGGALNQLNYLMGLPSPEGVDDEGNALAPFVGTGVAGELQKPFGMDEFEADPGYQFRLSEGIKALDRSASARGGIASGKALKATTRYGQDVASQEYQNAYNRYKAQQAQRYNQLAGLAGVGQTANAALGQAGQTYASNVGNLTMTDAANRGNAAIAAGNATASSYAGWGQSLSSGMNALGRYYGNQPTTTTTGGV